LPGLPQGRYRVTAAGIEHTVDVLPDEIVRLELAR
jgi:hypothetical protein